MINSLKLSLFFVSQNLVPNQLYTKTLEFFVVFNILITSVQPGIVAVE